MRCKREVHGEAVAACRIQLVEAVKYSLVGALREIHACVLLARADFCFGLAEILAPHLSQPARRVRIF